MTEHYTIAEFASKMRLSQTYVRHCANGYVNPRTGRQYQLPAGYVARKEGPGTDKRRQWIIYRKAEPVVSRDDTTDAHEQELYQKYKDIALEAKHSKAEADMFAKDRSREACYQEFRLATAIKEFGDIPLVKHKHPSKLAALKTLVQVLDMDLKLRRDADLASELATRWRYSVRHVTSNDLLDQEYPFEESSIYAISGIRQELHNPEHLLRNIGGCYQTSVTDKKTIRVELHFKPDGEWEMKLLNPDEPWFKLWLQEEMQSDDFNIFGNRLEYLFAWIWFLHITDQKQEGVLPKRYLEQTLTRGFVRDHPWRNEFLKRCLNCGEQRKTKRLDAHFCNDKPCKAIYFEWIKNQKHHNRSEVGRAISKKLDKLSKALA